MTPETMTCTRSTAEERRESLVKAAMPVCGRHGFHAASTLEIAKDAGISQPYLFPTKIDLFVAACAEASKRMARAFCEAADRAERAQVGASDGPRIRTESPLLRTPK